MVPRCTSTAVSQMQLIERVVRRQLPLTLTFLLLLQSESVCTQTTPDVRLLGGTPLEGRLEVYLLSQWVAVCSQGFSMASASVVCRSLGYSYANWTGFNLPAYGTSNLNVWVPGISCFGTEASVSLCPRTPLNSSACSHRDDVIVSCVQVGPDIVTTVTTVRAAGVVTSAAYGTTAPVPNGPSLQSGVTILPVISGCTPSTSIVLLDGPNAAVGRVHVRLGSTWGTVCASKGFDSNEAAIVCRQLCYDPAYARAVLPVIGSVYANNSVPIVMDSVSCTGSEQSLVNCTYSTSGVGNCTHRSDALVSCVNYVLGPPAAPVPDVSCTAVGATVTFTIGDTSQVTTSDVSLLQAAGCTSSSTIITQYSVILRFNYPGCMSAALSNSSHVIYSATVAYLQRGIGNGIITRTTQYSIPVKCLLVRQSAVQGYIIPLTQTAPPVVNVGAYVVSMVLYKDSAMQVPITSYPVNLTLGDYLTVGVNLASDGQGLRLVLPYCYATSAPSSGDTYVLLNQKCSVDSTVMMFSINDTMIAFRFQVFSFTTSSVSVYIHCEARVCANTEVTSECDRSCVSRRRRRQAMTSADDHLKGTYSISRGPIVLLQSPSESNVGPTISSGRRPATLPRLLLVPLSVSLTTLLVALASETVVSTAWRIPSNQRHIFKPSPEHSLQSHNRLLRKLA